MQRTIENCFIHVVLLLLVSVYIFYNRKLQERVYVFHSILKNSDQLIQFVLICLLEIHMGVSRSWCVILVIAACTCGARTECGETVQISFLTSVHDDPSCTKLSTKGVMLYEAAKLLAEIQNNKTDGFEISKSK